MTRISKKSPLSPKKRTNSVQDIVVSTNRQWSKCIDSLSTTFHHSAAYDEDLERSEAYKKLYAECESESDIDLECLTFVLRLYDPICVVV